MRSTNLKNFQIALFASVMLVLGVGFGVLVGNAGFGTQPPAGAAEVDEVGTSKLPLSTNANGQTYGSLVGREESPDHPDLVAAYGNKGELGYVYYDDVVAPEPKSPAEAVALNVRAEQEVTVPLYASDGVTQIDTYTVNKGAVTTTE